MKCTLPTAHYTQSYFCWTWDRFKRYKLYQSVVSCLIKHKWIDLAFNMNLIEVFKIFLPFNKLGFLNKKRDHILVLIESCTFPANLIQQAITSKLYSHNYFYDQMHFSSSTLQTKLLLLCAAYIYIFTFLLAKCTLQTKLLQIGGVDLFLQWNALFLHHITNKATSAALRLISTL